MAAADDAQDELRLLLAQRRLARGEDAPTLGRLFADTPGVLHTGDDPPGARPLSLEGWASGGSRR